MTAWRLPTTGMTVGHYVVLDKVASGGMATVFRVRRTGIGGFEQILAMKLMHPHLAEDPKFVSMFMDEIRVASRVEHPNVVRVLDIGEVDGVPWMVMELLRGQPLTKVLRRTPLTVGQTVGILTQVAEGLEAAHKAVDPNGVPLSLVHRDVSPHNIHLGYDGVVKVLDFGIAAALGRVSTTRTGEFKGKLGYASPEQITSSRTADLRSDIWAVGVIAWESFTRERLFSAEDEAERLYAVLHRPIPPLLEKVPDLHPELGALVDSCLSRDRERRPESALVLAQRLEPIGRELNAPHRRDLGELVSSLFIDEREEESQGLRALRAIQDPTKSMVTTAAAPKARREFPWIAAGVLAVVLAAAFAFALSIFTGKTTTAVATPPAAEMVESTQPPVTPPMAAEAEDPPPAQVRTVRVRVTGAARRVLVDNAVEPRRQFAVRVPPGEEIVVRVQGRGGRSVERTLDGSELNGQIEIAAPSRGSAQPPAARPSTGLVSDPYD